MAPGFSRDLGRRPPWYDDGAEGSSSLKVPPRWSPEMDDSYSFASWLADIKMWASATDVDEDRQGAAVSMRLHGGAKEIAREMAEQIITGADEVDTTGVLVHVPGLVLLIRALKVRFSPLDVEQSIKHQ